MMCLSSGSLSFTAHRFGSVVGSTIAMLASLFCMRYSSASGPNRWDSGRAIAPIWKIAMYAIAISGLCGSTSATRSPRFTPSAVSALDSRLAACWISQNV